jgi:uncharacterized protein
VSPGTVGSADPILIDSAVPLYAVGERGAMQRSCRTILVAIAAGRLDAFASVEMLQEFLFHRLRRTQDAARSVAEARDLQAVLTVLDFGSAVLDASLALVEEVQTVRGRDAVHAATALVFGISVIVTPDRAFDDVPGLRRLDPAELAAHLTR